LAIPGDQSSSMDRNQRWGKQGQICALTRARRAMGLRALSLPDSSVGAVVYSGWCMEGKASRDPRRVRRRLPASFRVRRQRTASRAGESLDAILGGWRGSRLDTSRFGAGDIIPSRRLAAGCRGAGRRRTRGPAGLYRRAISPTSAGKCRVEGARLSRRQARERGQRRPQPPKYEQRRMYGKRKRQESNLPKTPTRPPTGLKPARPTGSGTLPH
jgi:hypothetical protein